MHDSEKIIADLAAVALGGDCLADIAVLREPPDLAGAVASDPVVSRLVSARGTENGPGNWPGTTLPAPTATGWSRWTWTPRS